MTSLGANIAGQSNNTLLHNPQKGVALGFIGGIALSLDIPLIRMAGADPFVVMAARGFGLALVLLFYSRWISGSFANFYEEFRRRDFLIVGTLSGLNNVCFTLAVFNTSTANVVFILAFNAMLAALISWPMTGEKPTIPTLAAIFATIVGVALIVSESLGSGNLIGDALALACAALLAVSLTLTRKSGRDLSLAPGFGGLVSGLFALPTALMLGAIPEAPVWLLLDAVVLVPIAGVTLWLAPRFITAPQVALFYLLETVLAPLWVWMVFFEKPSQMVMIGGFIVVAAILGHTLYEISVSRQKAKKLHFQTSANKLPVQ